MDSLSHHRHSRTEILEIEVRPSVFSGRKGFTWGIKLDNSDLCRHVLVRRKTGFWKRIAFTPDNPDEFVRVCQSIMLDGGCQKPSEPTTLFCVCAGKKRVDLVLGMGLDLSGRSGVILPPGLELQLGSPWKGKNLWQRRPNTKGGANGRTQTFSFRAPDAMSVQLVGDFTQWQERPDQPAERRGRRVADDGATAAGHAPLPFPRGWRVARRPGMHAAQAESLRRRKHDAAGGVSSARPLASRLGTPE